MKIQFKNICKSFGPKKVLQNLNLEIEEKTSFVLLGGSGTGKSVLIKCLLGIITPDSGTILLDGEDITHLSTKDRLNVLKQFGVLFQGGALFDSLTIWENVAFRLLKTGTNRHEAKEKAKRSLESVELKSDILNSYPSELSGGMQKRAALARAITHQPSILCFDEPTTGLDPITSQAINHLITKCVKTLGGTAITITHDLISMKTIADQVGFLENGSIVWLGSPHDIVNTTNETLQRFIESYKGALA